MVQDITHHQMNLSLRSTTLKPEATCKFRLSANKKDANQQINRGPFQYQHAKFYFDL